MPHILALQFFSHFVFGQALRFASLPGRNTNAAQTLAAVPAGPLSTAPPQRACPTPQEQKALKDQAKRLGKKGKDEAARLEAEMAARHAAELAALDSAKEKTAVEAVAVADSLYSVHLGADDEGQQEGQQKVGAVAHATPVWQGGCCCRTEANLKPAGKVAAAPLLHATTAQGAQCCERIPTASVAHAQRPCRCRCLARLQKPSKSQRRREQRQREEQEREARIAAELAELGDTGEQPVQGDRGRYLDPQLLRVHCPG